MTAETYLDGRITLHCGDSRDVLANLPANSIDSVVCDPPYALVSITKRFGKAGAAPVTANAAYARASAGFMGKSWDAGEVAFSAGFWKQVLRVLKPGGHVVAFGGTRAFHRLVCAIEDAGFEIRDGIFELMSLDPHVRAFVESLSDSQLDAFLRLADLMGFEGILAWVYGTGFPKSLNVSKAIDKHNGNARPVIGRERLSNDIRGGALLDAAHGSDRPAFERDITSAASAASAAWEGFGTALKPAIEPICLARKPFVGTVAENVLKHGTGALNIDGCRVEMSCEDAAYIVERISGFNATKSIGGKESGILGGGKVVDRAASYDATKGRHPANVIYDGSPDVSAAFPIAPGQQGLVTGNEPSSPFANVYGDMPSRSGAAAPRGDTGSAARFFYSAKADADDRLGSKHPTVKPVGLMQWLCRLVTPPGGRVLDPFAGTGTTGEAAWREGFEAVLVEREAEYQADIRRRMALCLAGPAERKRESARAKGTGKDLDFGPLFAAGEAAE